MDRLRKHARKTTYRIKVRGLLDERWSARFDGLTITPQRDGSTVLAGPIRDYATLYGLLTRLQGLGLAFLAAERR
jgi:hypothetical protein